MATTIACVNGQSTAFLNVPVSVASVAAETAITVTVAKGCPVDLLMVGTLAWIYRATTSVTTNDMPALAAGQSLTLRYYVTTTFYILRSAADGVVTFTPLAINTAIP